MAAPTVAGVGANASSGDTTNLSVPYPAGIQAGDLLLVIYSCRWSGALTTPAGWAHVPSSPVWNDTSSSVTEVSIAIYYKIATGGESGGQNGFSGSGYRMGKMLAIRGQAASSYLHVAKVNKRNTTSTSIVLAEGETTLTDCLVVMGLALMDNAHSPGGPSNPVLSLTNHGYFETAAGDDGGLAVYSGAHGAGGGWGDTSVTLGGVAASFSSLAIAITSPDSLPLGGGRNQGVLIA